MSKPVVSVVVPTHNRPEQLCDCLTSLGQQTMAQGTFEVVVVDDGSEPLYDLDLAACSWPFELRLIRQKCEGPASARNHGVREARGDLVAFTDDDCRPAPTWLETLVASHQAHPSLLVGGSTYNGLVEDVCAETSHLILDIVYEHFNADPEQAKFFASNNILCGRDEYLAIGGFDERFPRPGAEDRDFCDRWRAAGKPLKWVPAALTEHRHPQSLRQFLNLHYRYGCGAFHYQIRRRERGSGAIEEDFGFFRTLFRGLPTHLKREAGMVRRCRILCLLLAWQVANTGGFFAESSRARGKAV